MTVLQALNLYYGRMAARGEAAPPGWSNEPIGFVVVLAQNGEIVDVRTHLDDKGKRPRTLLVPKPFNRQGTGSTPYLFWDNTAYALGVSEKDPKKTVRDHAASRQLHLDFLAHSDDAGVTAVRLFFANWRPDKFVPAFEPRMTAWNLVFNLDGTNEYVHERDDAKTLIDAFVSRYDAEGVSTDVNQCLVTGRIGPIRTLHTKIKGVQGTSNPEVPLVSFNQDAFESYGKKQAENAPVSGAAVARYAAALTGLLDRTRGTNRLSKTIGDTTVVFWADTSNADDDTDEAVPEDTAIAAERLFLRMFESESADDDPQETAKLHFSMEAVAKGRPQDVNPAMRPGTRFHVLGISPNAARLSIRFWLSDTFEAFVQQLLDHKRDLEIEPRPRRWGEKGPSIDRLLVHTTALREDFDNIPRLLAGEVMRAVLSGSPYPRNLFAVVLTRLRAGDGMSPRRSGTDVGWHAAVIKACLNRPLRVEMERLDRMGGEAERLAASKKEMLPVALDPDYESTAYQLGRLFAVIERAQIEALGRDLNATVADRYYGAASSTPARVFGSLMDGVRNHVSAAKKLKRGFWIDGVLDEIFSRLPPDIPKTLAIEDQGRFAVGYYHQRASRAAKGERAEDQTEENVSNG